ADRVAALLQVTDVADAGLQAPRSAGGIDAHPRRLRPAAALDDPQVLVEKPARLVVLVHDLDQTQPRVAERRPDVPLARPTRPEPRPQQHKRVAYPEVDPREEHRVQ